MTLWVIVSLAGSSLPVPAQVVRPPPGAPARPVAELIPGPGAGPAEAAMAERAPRREEKLIALNFRDAPLDQVLTLYSDLTGRTLIKSPGINATITLRGATRLTESEALEALDAVLAMNNVALVPMGEKFYKVVQPGAVRQEGMPIARGLPEEAFAENDALISQIITLKYIELAEAQTVIQGFIHGYGKVQPLERMGSVLITETSSNLARIMEILEYIDQPTEARVETRIYELKYAEAAKIAGKLNELIAEAQAKEEKPQVAVPAPPPTVPTPPGVIRARRQAAAQAVEQVAEMEAALAERGIVQGKVKIVADDRTNILIVISRPSNFVFFDKIVAILDRPVDPDVIVRVVALEYAKAEEIASILNEFVGAAKTETKAPSAAAPAEGGAEAARSQILQEYIAQQRAEARAREVVAEEKARIGQLSPNTKILADKRTNSLLLMGTRADLAALEDIINDLDTMLAQVLIEAVILEVQLSKGLQYGIDWLQRSFTTYSDNENEGPSGGLSVRNPLFSFGGGSRMSDGTTFHDGSDVTRNDPTIGAGSLTYYATIFDLNLDVVLRMAASSSDSRILSTPVILTTDNTEAKIIVGEERPVVTSTSVSSAGQQTSNYEYRNIGINLTVTPRINPQRFVVMEIVQTADNVGGFEVIDGNNVPIITKREMAAQIAVPSRSTIVLGGLVATDRRKTRAKVPILGDIPLLGALFRSDTDKDNRTELMVLLTPYVLASPEEAQEETERLYGATRVGQSRWYRGWSDSQLARPTRKQLKAEKKKRVELARQEAQRAAEDAQRPPQVTPRISVVVPSEMEGGVDYMGEEPEVLGEPGTYDEELDETGGLEEPFTVLEDLPLPETRPAAPALVVEPIPAEEAGPEETAPEVEQAPGPEPAGAGELDAAVPL